MKKYNIIQRLIIEKIFRKKYKFIHPLDLKPIHHLSLEVDLFLVVLVSQENQLVPFILQGALLD
jgi:hypothetical protein